MNTSLKTIARFQSHVIIGIVVMKGSMPNLRWLSEAPFIGYAYDMRFLQILSLSTLHVRSQIHTLISAYFKPFCQCESTN